MKYLVLPDKKERRLIFYLAMEEFAATELDERESFFTWRVAPTVIFGRNQLMEAEVDVSYCRQNDIQLYRRKSGGGCVYSDWGNLMLSYIIEGENVPFLFDRYLRRIAFSLHKKGINAVATGRNDILIDGKKISGNAFLKLHKRCIIHGTMLYDTDFSQMERALTPSAAKLESKGVASVRKRVANLRDYTDMDIHQLADYFTSELCGTEKRVLTAEEVHRIEEIEQTYLEDKFFKGRNPAYSITKSTKIDNVGEISVKLELRNDIIRKVWLTGDFFALNDVDALLTNRLNGVHLSDAEVRAAMENIDIGEYIHNLTNEQLIKLILKP